jgi:hypothetical protein
MNLKSSEDLGQVVFHLVEEGLMGRQDSDKPEDFNDILNLSAFDKTNIQIKEEEVKHKVPIVDWGIHLTYNPPSELKLNKN